MKAYEKLFKRFVSLMNWVNKLTRSGEPEDIDYPIQFFAHLPKRFEAHHRILWVRVAKLLDVATGRVE